MQGCHHHNRVSLCVSLRVCASMYKPPHTHAQVTYCGEWRGRTGSSYLVGLCMLLKKSSDPPQVHRHITQAKISVIYRHESLYRLL